MIEPAFGTEIFKVLSVDPVTATISASAAEVALGFVDEYQPGPINGLLLHQLSLYCPFSLSPRNTYFPFDELHDVAVQLRVIASWAVTHTFPSGDRLPLKMVPEMIGAAGTEISCKSISVESDLGVTFVNPLTIFLLSSMYPDRNLPPYESTRKK